VLKKSKLQLKKKTLTTWQKVCLKTKSLKNTKTAFYIKEAATRREVGFKRLLTERRRTRKRLRTGLTHFLSNIKTVF